MQSLAIKRRTKVCEINSHLLPKDFRSFALVDLNAFQLCLKLKSGSICSRQTFLNTIIIQQRRKKPKRTKTMEHFANKRFYFNEKITYTPVRQHNIFEHDSYIHTYI
uniref:Uncharacterized protein n=1 Tax=Bactrocera dorsalis TaxID=27457 RepID=A0A034VIK0_BACDO